MKWSARALATGKAQAPSVRSAGVSDGRRPAEQADSGGLKRSGAIPRREFGLRDPWLVNQLCRCMPRWLAIELLLLAVGAEGYERSEVSGVRSREAAVRYPRASLGDGRLTLHES